MELADIRHVQLLDGLTLEGSRLVMYVADVTAGTWLDGLTVASNCVLGGGDVVSSSVHAWCVSSCYAR